MIESSPTVTTALFALLAFIISAVSTPLIGRFALRRQIVDRPETAPDRKVQSVPVPLLGGLSVFFSFVVTVIIILVVEPQSLLGGYLLPKHMVGILIGGLLLMIGGILDDRRSKRPGQQLLWPILASLVIIASGIGITYVTNPFAEAFRLDQWNITLFHINDLPYRFVVLADLFALFWLMGMMYTTKFLDGLDGLVSGITVIGLTILFFLSQSALVGQPETALLALVGAGSFLGFLLFNFHPAKVFLGEGGSLFAGFLLGTLAILSGGKIATALLILGVPILDVLWVILRRFFREHRPITEADRKHLHFRLLDLGLSHRQVVVALYVITAIFASATLFVQGKEKIVVLGLVVFVMVLLGFLIILRARKASSRS